MKTSKFDYIVKKYNDEGCNYDNLYYATKTQANKEAHKGDSILICKKDSVYFGDNFQGWTANENDIIDIIRK